MNEQINFPDEYQLSRGNCYFETPTDPDAVKFCAARNALLEKAKSGNLFIKFIAGDRKGSIARLEIDVSDPINSKNAEISECSHRWDHVSKYEIANAFIFGTAKWDKRKNSCKVDFPCKDIVFLPNYEGPTVYEMFDKKAAKEALLSNPNQHDIDGKPLAVGDKVLYINARYGSRFVMCHGTIKEFKATVDSNSHRFTTIIQNDDGDEVSSITTPSDMVWKK